MGNGSTESFQGKCKDTSLLIRTIHYKVHLYVLDIEDMDLILEQSWLQTLVDVNDCSKTIRNVSLAHKGEPNKYLPTNTREHGKTLPDPFKRGRLQDGLYLLDSPPTLLVSVSSSDWHRRLGHTSLPVLQKALPDVSLPAFQCETSITTPTPCFKNPAPHPREIPRPACAFAKKPEAPLFDTEALAPPHPRRQAIPFAAACNHNLQANPLAFAPLAAACRRRILQHPRRRERERLSLSRNFLLAFKPVPGLWMFLCGPSGRTSHPLNTNGRYPPASDRRDDPKHTATPATIQNELQTKENILARQILASKEDSTDQLATRMTTLQQDLILQFTSLQKAIGKGPSMDEPPMDRRTPEFFPAQSSNGILGSPPIDNKTQVVSERPGNLDITCPRFSDSDLTDWLYHLYGLRQYFKYNGTQTQDYLLIASFHLDKPTSKWYQATLKDHPALTFPLFVDAIQKRFGPSLYIKSAGLLTKLQQTTTVLNFKTEFEELITKMPGLHPEFIADMFVSGLKEHIRGPVLLA
ncbi:hypothetical protein KSP39_PZI010920 [Platanthera zijinensis]|uniref:Retrotransposon gag domain-containing protein n=1 Tax=Platanthera zijinensis TaxID=2320716 RepID=A0AAP0G610_9ASPA